MAIFNAALELFSWVALLSILFGAALSIFLYFTSKRYPKIRRHKDEHAYLDPETVKSVDFPNLNNEQPTLTLSVIIPAYNEESRLPVMLDECIAFLEERTKKETDFTYEVIIVSDGSSDGTVSLALKYVKKYTVNKIRVLELIENRGKGGAVRLGMLSARGRLLLFADADGATKFADFEKLYSALKALKNDFEKMDAIAIGSRAQLEEQTIAERTPVRLLLTQAFHFLVWLVGVGNIRDTQCGFKLFTRSAAQKLFNSLHVERWAFDVELLYLAECLRIPVVECAVRWTEIDGSKLVPVWSWLQMAIDLINIKLHYTIGAWKYIESEEQHKKQE